MDKQAIDAITRSISFLIAYKPLFGIVFMYLNKIEIDDEKSMPTMAVGVTRKYDLGFYYNPKFVNSLTQMQLQACLEHEVLHILLQHISRAQHFNFNKIGYNIAADLAINSHLTGLPDKVLYPKNFNLPEAETAEWYYEKLKKEAQEHGKSMQDMAEGKGEMVGDHSFWSAFDEDIMKEKVRHIAEKAIEAHEANPKTWGNIPGNLAQAVMAANKPVVNWKKELRYFINKVIALGKKSTRMRPNRRFGYLNPSVKRDYVAKILVAIDTSGSISDVNLEEFAGEVNGIAGHVECHLIMFDTVLYGEPVHISKPIKRLEVVGRGGTYISPVFDLLLDGEYDGLVVLTDLIFEMPAKPKNIRILWCSTKQGEHVEVPFGKKVMMEFKKK